MQQNKGLAPYVAEELINELRHKSFDELSDLLFAMGDGEGQEDLLDVCARIMQEKCPPDDGSFDFSAALDTVHTRIAEWQRKQNG